MQFFFLELSTKYANLFANSLKGKTLWLSGGIESATLQLKPASHENFIHPIHQLCTFTLESVETDVHAHVPSCVKSGV